MAIYEYQSDSGDKLWKAYASVRSKIKPEIRVQKWTVRIKTQKQAEREETALIKFCQAEVSKRENEGETWGSLVETWELSQRQTNSDRLNECTRADYVATLEKYTSSWWKRPVSTITRADVVEVLSQMKAHSSSISYQNKFKAIINRVFEHGIDHRIIRGIDRSPARGIYLGRDEEKKPEILNILEIRKLLNEAKRHEHPWYPIWCAGLMTGMRSGELYALLWSDVDWENKQISVTKSYNCRKRITKSTKSAYWRTVPMSSELHTFLKALQETCQIHQDKRPEVLPRFPVWTKGEQARILRRFCEGIGLPSVKFHTLRACFATQLLRNSIPPVQVMKICGWKDIETMQRYIRLAGIEIEGATESLKVMPDSGVTEFAAELFAPAAGGQSANGNRAA
ncbi:MAG: site-specific integrase [Bdellovibrionales bacterium]|nr:site-specific integrase [Bdellovibrionales bacterium]